MNSTTEVTERIVFQFIDSDDDVGYASYVYDQDTDHPMFNTTFSAKEAFNFSHLETDDLVRLFYYFSVEIDGCPCEIVRTRTTVETLPVEINEDKMREIRQRIALKKLNHKDVEVLGLTNVATYIKTKYHNA